MVKAIASRLGAPLPSDWSPLKDQFSAFIHTYTELLRMIVNGYNFEKAENDFFDFAFLYYLSNPKRVFVTNEKRLRTKIGASSQADRVVSFQEALHAMS